MSDSEDEDSPLLLDPDAIDTIAKNAFWIPSGWCIHGPKCMRNWCMSADNPAQKMYKHATKVEGGARVEVDCQKGLLIVRLTNPHKTSGKTDMTKANVDYPAVIAAFEDPQMCFLEGVMRPPRAVTKFPEATSSSSSTSSSPGWSLTPYKEETGSTTTTAAKSTGWSITPFREEIGPQIPLKPKASEEKERRRRVAKPAHMFIESEVSLAALGRMDTNPDGSEVPWRKFRIQKKFDAEEEERKAALVRKVAGALKDKDWEPGDEEASGSSSSSSRPGTKKQEVEQYGPKVPGDFRAAMQEEMGRREDRGGQEVRREEQGETYVMRQLTGELPYGSRPDRYSGRWYKESSAGSSEPPVLEPTAAVKDFRKRRAETAAERLAAKAVKSHKANLEEFNDLMEKLPVHNEQRKINWYKF